MISPHFDKIKWFCYLKKTKKQNEVIRISTASFYYLTNEARLLFSSAFGVMLKKML